MTAGAARVPGTDVSRMSWAPFGMSYVSGAGAPAGKASMSPVMPVRVSMAPIQVTRNLGQAPMTVAPATAMPNAAMPTVAMSTAAPRTAAPRTASRQSTPTAAPRSTRATAQRQAQPATRRTAPPPGYPAQGYPPPGSPTQGYPPPGYPAQGYPPPQAPTTAYRTSATSTRRPRTAAVRTMGSPGAARSAPRGPAPRPTAPGRAGEPQVSLPFDPLALGALVAAFLFGPLGVLLALASIGRARRNRVPVAVSIIALLVGIVATAVTLGAVGAFFRSFG